MAAHNDPGVEAWELIFELFSATKRERFGIAQEYGLSLMQLFALGALEPGAQMPMSSLAEMLFCDASNVTGIVDRLEGRGLIERRPAPKDRRVKLLTLTEEGARVRGEATRRMHEPPLELASLSAADKRALRDILKKAVARRVPKAA